ncbi:hypothetical protein D3C85_1602920 [compost metagenome]
MFGRRRGTEIMVKTDHPANLGLAQIEGMSNLGDGDIGDVTDAFLNIMKNGQQRTRRALVALQQTVDHRQVQHLIRHSAILTVTDKPDGRRSSESVGCGTHTTSRYRGIFRPLARAP